MRKINQKAQSDIVSYVLLIVIAMSLAVGVYSFMKFYIPKDKETCSQEISLYVENYNCSKAIDQVEGEIKVFELTIKNNGLFNVTGFMIKATENYSRVPIIMLKTVGDNEVAIPGRYYFSEQLKAGASKITEFDYTDMSSIQRVQIQPFTVSAKGTILLCERISDVKIEDCS